MSITCDRCHRPIAGLTGDPYIAVFDPEDGCYIICIRCETKAIRWWIELGRPMEEKRSK